MDESIPRDGFVSEHYPTTFRYRIVWNRASSSVDRIDLPPSLGEAFAGMLLARALQTRAPTLPRVQTVEPNALSLNRHERRSASRHGMG
jgi:hypothetical protein